MSLQPYYGKCPVYAHAGSGRCEGWGIFEYGLCLPSDVNMSEEDQMRVASIVNGCFS